MKDINDLLAQFDDIQDNSISEEILGAYLEGTLSEEDMIQVENGINLDDSINELLLDISDLDSGNYDMLSDNSLVFPEPSQLFDAYEQNPFDTCFQTIADLFGFNIHDQIMDINHQIPSDDNINANEDGIHNDLNNF